MEIHRFTGGFPRRINILCDHCLLTGFVREQRVLGADVVRKCAEELKIPHYTGRRHAPQRPIPPRFESPPPAATVQAAAPPAAPVSAPRPQPPQPVPERPAPPPRQAASRQPASRRPPRSKWPLVATLALLAVALGLFSSYDEASFDRFYQEIGRRLAVLQNREGSGGPPPVPERQPESNPPPAQLQPDTGTEGATVPAEPLTAPAPETRDGSQATPTPPTPAESGVVSNQAPPQALPAAAAAPTPVDPLAEDAPVAAEEPAAAETTETMEVVAETMTVAGSDGGGEAEPVGAESPFEPVADESLPQSDSSTQPELPPPEPEAAAQAAELPQKTITVRFRSDSSELYFTDLERVDDFVDAIRQHPDAVLVISGHTDSLGSEGYNYRLSLFRANMVKSFFLGKGIPSHQLRVRAFGSEKPLVPNDTQEGRSVNRRVEINILQ